MGEGKMIDISKGRYWDEGIQLVSSCTPCSEGCRNCWALAMEQRFKGRSSEKWVFYNEDTEGRYNHRPKMMASLCKRAGIAPIGKGIRTYTRGKLKGKKYEADLYYGFHSLRHFMASHLIDQEKTSLKSVSMLLRHKALKTTEIYVHSIDESVRIATTKLEGKFTPELKPPQEPPQELKKESPV
jgi:integrase